MPKRKKTEEKVIKDGESVKNVSKDIDEIFAFKKPIIVATEKTGKGTEKPTKLQATPIASTEGNLAIIQSQVRALKSKQSHKSPQIEQKDDFADIRGTKKRIHIMPRAADSLGKQTADGFTMYNEDELKIGQGGDTPLCPFDCDCCARFFGKSSNW